MSPWLGSCRNLECRVIRSHWAFFHLLSSCCSHCYFSRQALILCLPAQWSPSGSVHPGYLQHKPLDLVVSLLKNFPRLCIVHKLEPQSLVQAPTFLLEWGRPIRTLPQTPAHLCLCAYAFLLSAKSWVHPPTSLEVLICVSPLIPTHTSPFPLWPSFIDFLFLGWPYCPFQLDNKQLEGKNYILYSLPHSTWHHLINSRLYWHSWDF